MKDISLLLDEIAAKDEKINNLIRTNSILAARRNLAINLAIKLINEGELAGSDWDYISEKEVQLIDTLINELKEKAFIDGMIKMARVMGEEVDEFAFHINAKSTAKDYAESRPWHDS